MQTFEAHEFEDGELADAGGENGFGELGVEEVVRKVDIEIQNHASSRTFRNRQSIVKRGEGEITLLNVKPAVGFTLPSAGVTPAPLYKTKMRGSVPVRRGKAGFTSPAAGDGVASRESGEVV